MIKYKCTTSGKIETISQASLVRNVLDKVALAQVLLPVLRSFLISIIPQMLYTDPFICHRIYMLSIDSVVKYSETLLTSL
jgi:hypothetical protein